MWFIPERRTWIRGTNATEARSTRPLTTKHDGLELGEGGPSVFEAPLAELRQSAVREAYNITSEQLEPEQWANGRMSITFERQLAHEYEGFRHKLTEHVAAQAGDVAEQVCEAISDVAVAHEELRVADRDLATVTRSWHATYRQVHEDELELGRYFRLRSVRHRAVKWFIAVALFLAEFAVSTALFSKVVAQDNQAYPVLFALGLILVLMVVPHYAAIGIKDGIFSYHEAEMRAYDEAGKPPPIRVRKKARQEDIDDAGIKLIAGVLGVVLVVLFIPLSSLRATELGGQESHFFWFCFFLLLQASISGYFFLREWMDHGAASVNLKHHDDSKKEAENKRAIAFEAYNDALTDFRLASQELATLYRQAPVWDEYVVQQYLGTIQFFREVLIRRNPDLAVFIHHAKVPALPLASGADGEDHCVSDVLGYGPARLSNTDVHRREWWTETFGAAWEESLFAKPRTMVGADSLFEIERPEQLFDKPGDLLKFVLSHYYNLEFPYRRPAVLDEVPEVEPEQPVDLPRVDLAMPVEVDGVLFTGGGGLTDMRSRIHPMKDGRVG